jgi:hypothetical protein
MRAQPWGLLVYTLGSGEVFTGEPLSNDLGFAGLIDQF